MMYKKHLEIIIKKSNQSYIYELLKKYPRISSGRKNYSQQYSRVLKNLLLSKLYNKISNKNKYFSNKVFFVETNKSLMIKQKNY